MGRHVGSLDASLQLVRVEAFEAEVRAVLEKRRVVKVQLDVEEAAGSAERAGRAASSKAQAAADDIELTVRTTGETAAARRVKDAVGDAKRAAEATTRAARDSEAASQSAANAEDRRTQAANRRSRERTRHLDGETKAIREQTKALADQERALAAQRRASSDPVGQSAEQRRRRRQGSVQAAREAAGRVTEQYTPEQIARFNRELMGDSGKGDFGPNPRHFDVPAHYEAARKRWELEQRAKELNRELGRDAGKKYAVSDDGDDLVLVKERKRWTTQQRNNNKALKRAMAEGLTTSVDSDGNVVVGGKKSADREAARATREAIADGVADALKTAKREVEATKPSGDADSRSAYDIRRAGLEAAKEASRVAQRRMHGPADNPLYLDFDRERDMAAWRDKEFRRRLVDRHRSDASLTPFGTVSTGSTGRSASGMMHGPANLSTLDRAHVGYMNLRREADRANAAMGRSSTILGRFGNAIDSMNRYQVRLAGLYGLIIAGLSTIGPLAAAGVGALAGLSAGLTVIGAAAVTGATGLSAIMGKVQQVAEMEKARKDPWQVQDAKKQELTATRSLRNAREQEVYATLGQTLAQRDLDDARRTAKRTIEDLTRSQEANRLSMEGSNLSAVRARVEYAKTIIAYRRGTVNNLDLAEAKNRYQVALNASRQARVDYARSEEDADRTARRGVERSSAVLRASQAMTQANRGVRDAAEASQDATYQLKKLRRELGYLLDDQGKETFLDHLFRNSGPEVRKTSEFIATQFTPALGSLRKASGEALAPGLMRGLENLLGYKEPVTTFFTDMNSTMGSMFDRMTKSFGSNPTWMKFFQNLATDGPKGLRDMGTALGGYATGWAGIMNDLRPTIQDMMSEIKQSGKSFAHWFESDRGQSFLDYIKDEGPKIADDLGDIIGGIVSWFEKMEDVGRLVLDVLAGVGRAIDKMPKWAVATFFGGSAALGLGAVTAKAGRGLGNLINGVRGSSRANPLWVSVVNAVGTALGGGVATGRNGTAAPGIVGTGPGGRVTRADLRAHAAANGVMGSGRNGRLTRADYAALRASQAAPPGRFGRIRPGMRVAGGLGTAAMMAMMLGGGMPGMEGDGWGSTLGNGGFNIASMAGTGFMMAGPVGAAIGASFATAVLAADIGKKLAGDAAAASEKDQQKIADAASPVDKAKAAEFKSISQQLRDGDITVREATRQRDVLFRGVTDYANENNAAMPAAWKAVHQLTNQLGHAKDKQDKLRDATDRLKAAQDRVKRNGGWTQGLRNEVNESRQAVRRLRKELGALAADEAMVDMYPTSVSRSTDSEGFLHGSAAKHRRRTSSASTAGYNADQRRSRTALPTSPRATLPNGDGGTHITITANSRELPKRVADKVVEATAGRQEGSNFV